MRPLFQSQAGGDLRLTIGSPCIDGGDSFVDTELLAPGIQPLPALDLAGDARIVDGDANGLADVAIGAHEFQGG